MSKSGVALFTVLHACVIGHAQVANRSDQQPGPDAVQAPSAAKHEHAVPRNERERRLLLLHLASEHSLHEAAVANGGRFVLEHNVHAIRSKPREIRTLMSGSGNVLVGTPIRADVRLSPDGTTINTYYDVSVFDSIKGRASRVVVKIPGGLLAFPDGAVAEVRTPNFDFQLGNRYLLFLTRAPSGPRTDPADAPAGVLVPLLGPQGIFDVTSGQVRSLALETDPIRTRYQDRSADEFLKMVAEQLTTTGPPPKE